MGDSGYLLDLCRRAKAARGAVGSLEEGARTKALRAMGQALMEGEREILAANARDCALAAEAGMAPSFVDRLYLDRSRLTGMAKGLEDIAALPSVAGEEIARWQRPNGLVITQKRVPLGVVGIIYEARPNVTSDAFGLCFKSGNVALLKGGKEALATNMAIAACLRQVLAPWGLEDALLLIEDGGREITKQLFGMVGYVDVLIPRGGQGLIREVVEHSRIPVIETGAGNCHIYVDAEADLDMALDIIDNAKTQRVSVCNACESLVVHQAVAETFLPMLCQRLEGRVELRGDAQARGICLQMEPATEEDFAREYLDYILSIAIVPDVEGAMSHINQYNTGHSEAIITRDEEAARRFVSGVDSACLYVNASTRFTDGGEFGFGGEIGISTSRLHARGPMGLVQLCSSQYVVYGQGQTR